MSKSREETIARLARLGISTGDARTLMRISATLGTWCEDECNGFLERDEDTGKCYWTSDSDGKRMARTSDRERPAVERAKKIAATYALSVYYQTDPRGCAIYVYRETDLRPDQKIDSVYSSIGYAVCP